MREPLRWQTHLGKWITDVTATRVVEELRGSGYPLTTGAVYKWVSGERIPRPDVAFRLVEISGGALTFADIYQQRFELRSLHTRGAAPGRHGEDTPA